MIGQYDGASSDVLWQCVEPDILLFTHLGLPCLDWIGFTGGDGVSMYSRIVYWPTLFLTRLIAQMLENHRTVSFSKTVQIESKCLVCGRIDLGCVQKYLTGNKDPLCSNSGDISTVLFCKRDVT